MVTKFFLFFIKISLNFFQSIGGIIGGLVSDIIKRRSVVVTGMLILAIPSLYIYSGNFFLIFQSFILLISTISLRITK